jgi:hypothetical protein
LEGEAKIVVQATKTLEDGGTSWGPATIVVHPTDLPDESLQDQHEPVVLHGGIIYWLLTDGDGVLTYDIRTDSLGIVKLPPTNCRRWRRLLGKSPDGRLRLLAAERSLVSVWLQHSDGLVKEATIDVEQQLRSLNPNTSPTLTLTRRKLP